MRPDALRKEEGRWSRRGFLAGSAGAAALAAAGAGGFWVPRKRRMTGCIVGPDQAVGHRIRDGGLPDPDRSERASVVIVGSGIAGLAAAQALRSRGIWDWVLLELESRPGGNSACGANAVSAFPWGAHYLPLPGPDAGEVSSLLREFGVMTGQDSRGLPMYREEFLVHDPAERLFLHGRWQEGMVPSLGLSPQERDALEAFFNRMSAFKERIGTDGRPAFTIPLDASSADPELRALDRIDRLEQGFTSAPCAGTWTIAAAMITGWRPTASAPGRVHLSRRAAARLRMRRPMPS
ncbi:MAG: NAD(P)-binding protein [Verrucomicrobiae bacterium]|nr:NAD(P)-binding protein [Verrucomicrobiae bacterium]